MFYSSKGSALVQVIIVMAVFAIIATTLITLSTTEYVQSERTNEETQAYYHAKSGVEMARRLFEKNFAVYSVKTQFYLYGDLGSNITISDTAGSGSSQIAVTVTNTARESDTNTHDVAISSTGIYNQKQEHVTYKFSFTLGTDPGEPAPPPIGEGTAIDGGSETGEAGWYDSSNGDLSNSAVAQTVPVIFNVGGGGFVYKYNNCDPGFIAPQMFFLDQPLSLQVYRNMDLILHTDFIYFRGDVDGEAHSKPANNGHLILKVNNSLLSGSMITNAQSSYADRIIPGATYGLIYLGAQVRNSSSVLLNSPGYYYFPDGVNLATAGGIAQLVKISDINDTRFDLLNITITTGGGISGGIYQ